MAEAKRPKTTQPSRATSSVTEVDPRIALAQKYLKSAQSELMEKEQSLPRSRRKQADGARATGFSFSVAPSTYLHILLAAIGLTFDALALTMCYHVMMVNFTAGRVMALPAGVVTAAVWAYLSVCYLGVIESTSTGRTEVDVLQGDWRDWFWTLPASLGMFAISAVIGWALSFVFPANVGFLIAISALVTYPFLQLSSLETGSPLAPISLPVLASMAKHPIAWFVLYAISFASAEAVYLVGRLAWHDPPYATIVILGPIVTVALFFYAWLLGQLAHLISTGEVS